ncbi:MAG TPA: right-handed parallel beta-helix repeat-containing protein [Acidimicrobiales bacterium]|nr:right-handed parallel beta-helix repeat-containing protein [Acidimicrobiales bacterium]
MKTHKIFAIIFSLAFIASSCGGSDSSSESAEVVETTAAAVETTAAAVETTAAAVEESEPGDDDESDFRRAIINLLDEALTEDLGFVNSDFTECIVDAVHEESGDNYETMMQTIMTDDDAYAMAVEDAAIACISVLSDEEFEMLAGDAGDPLPDALRVPDDYATIQDAVDDAVPGDLILIAPGTYYESVIVETDDSLIRGLDRNEVIIDGQHERPNGFIVFSNGVAIENLTSHSHTSNGIFFTGDYGTDIIVDGYRASYVTTYNNGLYGLYAFNAQNGVFEHSYGSGHPDSGFYIGQCNPCNAVIDNVISEHNALGYSGTNASNNIVIMNSIFRHNRLGVVPNTLDSEELAPQGNITVVGNLVTDNGNEETPRRSADWDIGFGVGIVAAGGNDNLIVRNRVENNSYAGIALSIFFDQNLWEANGNTVIENVVSGSEFDLAYVSIVEEDGTYGSKGNCFSDNTFATSSPADIETFMPCDGEATNTTDTAYPNPGPGGDGYGVVDHDTMPVPDEQPSMPDADSAEGVPAGPPPSIDIDSIGVPSAG